MRKRLFAFLIIFILVLQAVPVSAADVSIDTAYETTAEKLTKLAEDAEWDMDVAWIVLALARSGDLTQEQAQAYANQVAATVDQKGSAKLSENQSSDNSKTVLTLTAIGCDVTNVLGYDLLAPLSDIAYIKRQGMNGPIWALLAFDSNEYEIPVCSEPKKQVTREALVDAILSTQRSDHGWAYSGASSDVDMTCMAIQALSPYYDSDERVRTAVDEALEWVSENQNADGSFSSMNTVCSESASQAIVALTTMGIDPVSDERFVKEGNGAIDALLDFYVSGGGFKHIESNYKYNVLASMQGLYALVAYYRFEAGENSLYQMTDALDMYQTEITYKGDEDGGDDEKQDPADDTDGKDDEPDTSGDDKQDQNTEPDAGQQNGNDDANKDRATTTEEDNDQASENTAKTASGVTKTAGGSKVKVSQTGKNASAEKEAEATGLEETPTDSAGEVLSAEEEEVYELLPPLPQEEDSDTKMLYVWIIAACAAAGAFVVLLWIRKSKSGKEESA